MTSNWVDTAVTITYRGYWIRTVGDAIDPFSGVGGSRHIIRKDKDGEILCETSRMEDAKQVIDGYLEEAERTRWVIKGHGPARFAVFATSQPPTEENYHGMVADGFYTLAEAERYIAEARARADSMMVAAWPNAQPGGESVNVP
jgi:hypothetical protein